MQCTCVMNITVDHLENRQPVVGYHPGNYLGTIMWEAYKSCVIGAIQSQTYGMLVLQWHKVCKLQNGSFAHAQFFPFRTSIYIIDHVNFWSHSPRGATKKNGIKCAFLLTQTVDGDELHRPPVVALIYIRKKYSCNKQHRNKTASFSNEKCHAKITDLHNIHFIKATMSHSCPKTWPTSLVHVRRRQIKSKLSYRLFEQPIIWHTSDELSQSNFFLGSITPKTNFTISDVFGVIDPRKKFDRESSSEVCQMMGCSNQRYESFDFICRRLMCNPKMIIPEKAGNCWDLFEHPGALWQ